MVDLVALAEKRKSERQTPLVDKAEKIKTSRSGISERAEATPMNVRTGLNITDLIGATASSIKMGDTTPFEIMIDDAAQRGEGRLVSIGKGMDRLISGGKQAALDVGALLGLNEEQTADAFTKMKKEERELVEARFKEQFGDKVEFKIMEVGGQVAPLLLVPGVGQTAATRILAGTLLGGSIGSSDFEGAEDLESRLSERMKKGAIGAGVGASASTVIEALTFIKGMGGFAKGTLDALKDKGKLDRASNLSEKTGVDFKLSQAVDDPAVRAMESTVQTGISGARQIQKVEEKQSAQVIKFFKDTISKIQKASGSNEKFGVRVSAAFNKTLDGVVSTRRANATRNFSDAQKVVSTLDDPAVIPTKNFLQAIDDKIAELQTRGATNVDDKAVAELAKIRNDFANGRMSPIEMQTALRRWGDAAQGKGKRFADLDDAADRRLANDLEKALKKDLDQAVDSPEIIGAKELRKARDQYRKDSQPIQEMKDAGLESVFGRNIPKNQESIETAFLNMPPSQHKKVMDILTKTDPGLKESLQASWLKKALNDARKVRAGDDVDDFPLKSNALLSLKDDRDKLVAVFGRGEHLKDVLNGINALAKISINRSKQGGSLQERIKAAAGVAASGDMTFVARLFAETFTPKVLQKIVRSNEGVKMLEQLAKPFNQNRWAAALSGMSRIAFTSEEIKELRESQPPQQ